MEKWAVDAGQVQTLKREVEELKFEFQALSGQMNAQTSGPVSEHPDFIRPSENSMFLISWTRLHDAKRSSCFRTFATRIVTAFASVPQTYRRNLKGGRSTINSAAPRKAAFPIEILEEIYTTTYSNYGKQIDALVKSDPKFSWKTVINTCIGKKLQKLNSHFGFLIAGDPASASKYVTAEDLESFKEYDRYSKDPELFKELDRSIDELRSPQLSRSKDPPAPTSEDSPVNSKRKKDAEASSDSECDSSSEMFDEELYSSEDDDSSSDTRSSNRDESSKRNADALRKKDKEIKRLKRIVERSGKR